MPTSAFLPWSTLSERVRVGSFHLVPCGEAIASGEVPPELKDGVVAILSGYGKTRAVDRRHVPLIHHESVGVVDDLSDELVEAYFDFRQRLAFSVLAARRFFQHRYANSENASLVVQRFTPEHAGATVITSRRRDGSVNNIIPKGLLKIRRPDHVDGWCELPRDLDTPLLEALEQASASAPDRWPQLADAIRLFVGANTDSPDVAPHSELVDLVSAFSRTANVWKEADTVSAFVKILPSPPPPPDEARQARLLDPALGPKLNNDRVASALESGRSLREVWLSDAYILRSQVGHGRVAQSPYPSIWTLRQHLLLGAVAFPLYVKGILASNGLYSWSREDEQLNDALDALLTIEPFAVTADDDESNDAEGLPKKHPWREVFFRAASRRLARILYAEWAERLASSGDNAVKADDTDGAAGEEGLQERQSD